jgi:carbon storage regulator
VLFITRRKGEKVIVGETTIEVVEVNGNTVRLGISAPREVPIYREELWIAVKQQNEAAAEAAATAELPGASRPTELV